MSPLTPTDISRFYSGTPPAASTAGVTRAATLAVPYAEAGTRSHTETVADALALPSHAVLVWLQPGVDADVNTADMLSPVALAGTAAAGAVTFTAEFASGEGGPVKLFYQLATVT